uniref:Bublin coiled coil protein n=1 Tax=Latimeria chalumnae TaxID=7897 RepID=H3AYI1_LATCH
MPGPNGDLVVSLEDTCSEEEYMAINSMLDQINSCLDNLEETNKSLNAKLMELLESNRQIRQEFKE